MVFDWRKEHHDPFAQIARLDDYYLLSNHLILVYDNVLLRPGPVCCPEVYRDVPGKFHDDDDEHDQDLQWM